MNEPVEKHGWFHRWSKWTSPEPHDLTSAATGQQSTAYMQSKTCLDCGLVEHRYERIDPS